MSAVARFILKRILQAIPLLLVTSIIVFSLIQLAPFDVIDSLTTPDMTAEQIELLRAKHGLDQPVWTQYTVWLGNILRGELGNSLLTHRSIAAELAHRLPNTMMLVLPAYITALLLAIVLGLWAAAHRGKRIDRFVEGIISIGIATPTFWFAMLLMYFFGYQLNWFAIVGMHTPGQEGNVADLVSHYVLPYVTLTVAFFPRLTRYIRASAIEQLSEDYVMVQRAFKASRREIFVRHIGRNIWVPIVTQIGLALPMLVTGAIITESVFSWPGIGPYLMGATRSLDYPIIMVVMLLSAVLVILGNLLADILYSVVDPRIRQQA